MFYVFEALPWGLSVVDRDLNVVFMNSKLKARMGDLVGKKCKETELGSPDICAMCPVTGDWDYEKGPFVRRAADVDGRTYEFTVMKMVDPATREPYWISMEHDLTDSLETERKMRTLAASIDQMSDPVCISDTDGRLVYVNKAYARLTGYDEKRLHGMGGPETPSGPSGSTMNAIMKAAADRSWHGEMTGLRKDGTRYYTHVDAKPVRDSKGLSIAVVAIVHDITKDKTERVETEKYTSELESKMEARTTELARKVSQLTTINKISRVVTSILDPDELMAEFVRAIAQGFGYQVVLIMMLDKERGDLYLKAVYGRDTDVIPKDMRQKLKEGIIGHAAFFGDTLVSGNVDADPRYIRKYLIGTKSELSVPVTFRGEVLAILDVQSDIRDAFTRNDVSILEMLADMLANAITNARIYTESKEREAALSVLDRISKQISYRLEPEVILDQVSRDAATLLKAEKAMVGLADETTRTISWVAPYRIDKETIKSLRFEMDKGVTGRALKWLKTEVVNDYLADPDAIERDAEAFQIRSLVVAPLIIEGRGIGTINVYNKLEGKPFTKSDALFLSSLADHAAVALENANLLSSLNQRVHSQLVLLDTAISMQRQIDSTSTYELVSEKLREVVWYDAITFYKIDSEKMMVIPVSARGPYHDEVMNDSFPVGIGITGTVAKTGRAELVNDALNDSRVAAIPGTPMDEEALMAIPLVGKQRVIGILTLYRTGKSRFTDAEFEIAQVFASQAAVAVENAELYRTMETLLADSRRKVEQVAKVLELTMSVMYMDDLDKLLQRVTDAVVESFGFRRASIRILDVERDAFVLRALSGYPKWVQRGSAETVQNVLEDLDDQHKMGATSYYTPCERQKYGIEAFSFLAHPELADKPRAAPDAWHERDIFISAFKDRSGRLSGYLLVDEPNDLKIPSEDKIEVVEILASIASIAVENSKTYERQVLAANEIALLNDLMTHDINNFNQGIMGYVELLLQDKLLDDNQKKYAERALVQVKNNARLIDNIRKLAKVRLMSDSDLEPTDLQKAVAEAIETVTKANADRKLMIVSSLLSETHYVNANQYIHDLFTNVISNAVKFDSSRRVRVDVHISEDTTAQGEVWVISVIDRGRGIPDDRKNVVFERFATGMTGIKGFGLGLSIVSSIVNKYGGRIWVEDRVMGDFTKGTVFKIILPKAKAPPKRQPQGAPTSSVSVSTPRPPSQDHSEEEQAS